MGTTPKERQREALTAQLKATLKARNAAQMDTDEEAVDIEQVLAQRDDAYIQDAGDRLAQMLGNNRRETFFKNEYMQLFPKRDGYSDKVLPWYNSEAPPATPDDAVLKLSKDQAYESLANAYTRQHGVVNIKLEALLKHYAKFDMTKRRGYRKEVISLLKQYKHKLKECSRYDENDVEPIWGLNSGDQPTDAVLHPACALLLKGMFAIYQAKIEDGQVKDSSEFLKYLTFATSVVPESVLDYTMQTERWDSEMDGFLQGQDTNIDITDITCGVEKPW